MKETVVGSTAGSSTTGSKPGSMKPGSTFKSKESSPITIAEYTDDYQERIVIAPYGKNGSGKSRLGATGRGDIAAVFLDRKAKQTIVATCKEFGKRLYTPNIDLVRAVNPMQAATLAPYCKTKEGGVDERQMAVVTHAMDIFKPQPMCCAIHHYRWHVNRVKYTLQQMAQIQSVNTIIIDSSTILWDDILFANHGRTSRINPIDRASDNREMQEVLSMCYGKDLVLTMREGDTWKNNKPTGEVEYKGYGHMGYEVGAILHLTRDDKTGTFYCDVELCQANAALHGDGGHHDATGLVDEAINMEAIARAMYPDRDWDDWS